MKSNQPIVDLLNKYAINKEATPAQISLAWMLHKYDNLIPIPGAKKVNHILENLKASEIKLTKKEFTKLEEELNTIKIYGHRGVIEMDGSTMKEWER